MDLERDQEIQKWIRRRFLIININVGGWIVVGVKMEVRIPSIHIVFVYGVVNGTGGQGVVVGNQVKN